MSDFGRRGRVFGIGRVLLLVASFGFGQQTARFDITPDPVLVDERFSVKLDGLKPRQDVTIRVDSANGIWHSSVTVKSDDRGHAEAPDPMKLIWSAPGTRPAGGIPPALAQAWTFTAEADGAA